MCRYLCSRTQARTHPCRDSITQKAWVILLLLSPSLFTQIIADPNAPGHQQPTVGITANGIPQIDIQTPNAAGLSHNQYQQFDVQTQGAILNNSRETVQTQLGGHITGNPHLIQSGPATTILNEVRSSDPSVLRGFIEVAGQKANVIVANPSGITCDGCGFINAHRSTLTTGTPIINSAGNLEAYRVTTGSIKIFGRGLSDQKTYYTHILTRAIEINAKIHANRLTAITGANHIPGDPNHPAQLGPPVPIAADRDHKNPAFAIDVAELGGLYAGHAYLIGTEAGLGIRTAKGGAFRIGEFQLTSAGEIVHRGTIQAEGNIDIQAAKGIINQAAAAGLGGAVGTAAGGMTGNTNAAAIAGVATGLNIDANNRQLHPTEIQWIKANVKRYADKKGISTADAEKQLSQQAYRQVQFGVPGQSDAEASAFLSTAGKQLLLTDPAFANSGPGYIFYATPAQKTNTEMYAKQSAQQTQFAQKNGLTTPTQQQIQQAQHRDSNIRDNVKVATTAATAIAATVPPALSWCLSNPVCL